MASFPPIKVPVWIQVTQAIADAMRLNVALQKNYISAQILNRTLSQTNQTLSQTSGVLRGVGSFFILNRVLGATTNFLREGIHDAIEFQSSMNQLGIITQASTYQLEAFRTVAEKVAAALGPLSTTDVIQGMGMISQILGISGQGGGAVVAYTRPISEFVSNIVQGSGRRVTPTAGYEMAVQMLNSFGGVHNEQQVGRLLQALHAGIFSYAAFDPEKLIHGIRAAAPTFLAMGLPPEQAAALAVFRTVLPVSGQRGAGRDIAAFLQKAVLAVIKGSQHGKAGKDAASAAAMLGLSTGDLSTLIDPSTGRADVPRLIHAMGAHISSMRGPQFIQKFIGTFNKAFGSELASRIGMALSLNPTLLDKILDTLNKSLSIQEVAARILSTPEGALAQLLDNVKSLRVRIFDSTATLIGVLARGPVNSFVASLLEGTRRSPAMASAMGVGAMGLAGGATMGIIGTLLSGVGRVGGAVGGMAVFGAQIAMLVGLLSLLFAGAIYAYQQSGHLHIHAVALANTFILVIDEALSEVRKSIVRVVNKLNWPYRGAGNYLLELFKTASHKTGLHNFQIQGYDPTAPPTAMIRSMEEALKVLKTKGYAAEQFLGGAQYGPYGWNPYKGEAEPGYPGSAAVPSQGMRAALTERAVSEFLTKQLDASMSHYINGGSTVGSLRVPPTPAHLLR